MPILLDKVLTAFTMPLSLALIGLLAGLILVTLHRPKTGRGLAILSLALLWTAATPAVADLLIGGLEQQYPAESIESYPTADVVIVLGGAISPPTSRNPYPDLSDASDRLLHAYRIYKAGKAAIILLSGGQVFDPGAPVSEADAMAGILVSFGVPREAIIVEGKSRNTHENAELSAGIFRDRKFGSGLLVTSASHMPRAFAAFRKAGIAVTPATTDVSGVDNDPFPLPWLPDAASLSATSRALKEYLGLQVYRLRGWA